MNNVCVYFKLHLKRYIKSIPSLIFISLLIGISLFVLSKNMLDKKMTSEEYTKFTIGVVANQTDSYMEITIDTLTSVDSSRSTINFINMDEKEAYESLASGEIYAYIIIPDDFIQSASKGEIKDIEYVTLSEASVMSSVVKDEVLKTFGVILNNTQKGIYAAYWAMSNNNINDADSKTDNMAIEYLSYITKRSNMYDVNEIGIADSLSYPLYFLCSFIVIYICITGIIFSLFFSKDMLQFHKLLYVKGVKLTAQVLSEYMAYFVAVLLSTIPIVVMVLYLYNNYLITDIYKNTTFDSIYTLLAYIVIGVLCISAIQFLMYEAVSGLINQIIVQFVVFTLLCYLSGCFYPISFFPESIQLISSFIPIGMVREFVSIGILGNSNALLLLGLIAYTVVFLLITIAVRKIKLKM